MNCIGFPNILDNVFVCQFWKINSHTLRDLFIFLREYTRPHSNLFSRRVFFVFSSYILYKAVSQDSFLNKRNTPLCVMFNSNFFFFSFALVFLNAYETMTEIDLVDFPASRDLTQKYLYRQFLLDGFCPHVFWGFVSQTKSLLNDQIMTTAWNNNNTSTIPP